MDNPTHGRDQGGFSLIELMVVIAILGTLASIALPIFLGQRSRGYDASVRSDLRNAATAQESYNGDYNTYTTSSSALLATGWKKSPGVTLTVVSTRGTTGSDSYCLQAVNSRGGSTWWFDSTNGQASKTPCT